MAGGLAAVLAGAGAVLQLVVAGEEVLHCPGRQQREVVALQPNTTTVHVLQQNSSGGWEVDVVEFSCLEAGTTRPVVVAVVCPSPPCPILSLTHVRDGTAIENL